MKTDKKNAGKEQVRVPQNGRKSKIRVKPLDPTPTSLTEPVSKSTPPRNHALRCTVTVLPWRPYRHRPIFRSLLYQQ
jgi:hypothetical protein